MLKLELHNYKKINFNGAVCIVIPNGVTAIEEIVNSGGLNNVIIPSSVISIDADAFLGTKLNVSWNYNPDIENNYIWDGNIPSLTTFPRLKPSAQVGNGTKSNPLVILA